MRGRMTCKQISSLSKGAFGLFITLNIFTASVALANDNNIDKKIENYIMTHPDVILKSVEAYHNQQVQKAQSDAKKNILQMKKELYEAANDPVIGPKDAKFKVIEFYDYSCGYCKKMTDTVKKLSTEGYGFTLKELPVLGPASELKARYSLAFYHLNPQRFGEYHVMLFDNNLNQEEQLASKAAALGVSADKIKEVAKSQLITDVLNANRATAVKLGINGTPGYIIGDNIIPGYLEYNAFKDLIKKEENAKK
jgi:protein-disulfide isomerase